MAISRDPQQVKVQIMKTNECSALNEASIPHILFLRLGDQHRMRVGKSGVQRCWKTRRQQQGKCTHELTACDMPETCASSSQTKFQGREGSWARNPTVAVELLATVGS